MEKFIQLNIVIWLSLLFICQWAEPVVSQHRGLDAVFDNYYKATKKPYYNPFGYTNCKKGKFRFEWMKHKSSFFCPADVEDRQLALDEYNHYNDYNNETRIIKGYYAEPGEFPSFVYLEFFKSTEGNYCGGVLLNEYLILTAAHCLEDKNEGFAYAGSIDRNKGQKRAIKLGCTPIKLLGTKDQPYDWAILELFDKFELTKEVQPACVNFDYVVKKDIRCVAVGFGRNDLNERSFRLKAAVMKQAEPYIDEPGIIWTSEAGGQTGSGKFCQGDSGGPLYCFENCSGSPKMYVVGLASFYKGKGSCVEMNLNAFVNTVSWRKKIPWTIKFLMDRRKKGTLRRPASPDEMDVTALETKELACEGYLRPK